MLHEIGLNTPSLARGRPIRHRGAGARRALDAPAMGQKCPWDVVLAQKFCWWHPEKGCPFEDGGV